jgi:hypothetical protein
VFSKVESNRPLTDTFSAANHTRAVNTKYKQAERADVIENLWVLLAAKKLFLLFKITLA